MARIYLSPPHLDDDTKSYLIEALESNWITTLGPQVDAFEREICSCVNVKHALALSSGTAALHLAAILTGVERGDEVICSDHTFVASANVVAYCGGIPVFIDSNRSSWNMDPDLLEEELAACARRGKLPRAAIVVDMYGQCAEYREISAICQRYGVPIIEDAAEALGAQYGERFAGTFGVMGVFSFNGNKIITTSGGGMLVSDDERLIQKARFLSTQAREPVPYYEHRCIGYNYRLSNLLAALGRAQLRTLNARVARRRQINQLYREQLEDLPGLSFMPETAYGHSSCWLTCITIDPNLFGASSEDIRLWLEEHDIESRHVWKPMHLQPVFARCRCRGGAVDETLFRTGLCLPSGSSLADDDVRRIAGLILSTPARTSAAKLHAQEA
jgi:dTDP-4-amino-4,6-dideoxygalactose transaminase